MMEYKGYTAGPIDFDPEENTFSGTVVGLKDVIHFEGSNSRELVRAFHASIDSYLDLCKETGKQPDRPYNGKILVRTEPALHRKAAMVAASEGISLNQWITRQVETYLRERVRATR
ncbi:MAG TPA: type II toxin-antitoxin system HicB family antitoxin [Terracidiphilus sp.]